MGKHVNMFVKFCQRVAALANLAARVLLAAPPQPPQLQIPKQPAMVAEPLRLSEKQNNNFTKWLQNQQFQPWTTQNDCDLQAVTCSILGMQNIFFLCVVQRLACFPPSTKTAAGLIGYCCCNLRPTFEHLHTAKCELDPDLERGNDSDADHITQCRLRIFTRSWPC